jgi:DNA-binding NarL/FixJ family response regulator
MKIILADDHPDVRSALQLLLEQEEGFSVTAKVANLEDLWMAVKNYCPDLLLLDWELPGSSGKELIEALRAKCSKLVIIVLSGNPEARNSALFAGADGFISKGSPPQEVISTVNKF